MDFILRNLNILSNGVFKGGDLSVGDGRVVSVQAESPKTPGAADLDLSGLYAFPGFADVHVHLREPGFSYKETIRTGTLAAARGGFTEVCAMPNLDPVPDGPLSLQTELDIIERDAAVPVRPYGALSLGERGEVLADMAGMAGKVAAFSDDGRGLQSDELMERAMLEAKRLGKIVAAHCEDDGLTRGGYIHDGDYARQNGHRGIPSESEWRQIERDLGLVRKTGCAYHVCHVSAKESVALIRAAKKAGLDVSCETAPHYLILDDSRLEDEGRFRMNPPIRSAADRRALLEGILDGTVDMVATDHAPHSEKEKSGGLRGSLNGVVGLETAFPVLYTALVKPGLISLEKLVDLLNGAPRRRFGVGGILEAGVPANFTVFDLNAEYAVDPSEFLSLGRSTPFEGMRVFGRCLLTAAGGKIVWADKSLGELR